MRKRAFGRATFLTLAGAALVLATIPAAAQRQRASPHETVSQVVDGARIIVVYGRPYKKGREIWGGLVPWDRVWRLGADEATLLITQRSIQLGGLAVPAGAHSLYMLPSEKGSAKLIVNKAIGQWGTEYDEKQDLGRVDMTREAVNPPVEQLTISIEKNPAGGGLLKVTWDNASYSVPFSVVK
ncbi:MAG TPA: DUF2911 domain-containing protein [Vicinamibacterales bacterium]|nr:DUF2911 domain-containing protein [Vicinamibacterales bacterium]